MLENTGKKDKKANWQLVFVEKNNRCIEQKNTPGGGTGAVPGYVRFIL